MKYFLITFAFFAVTAKAQVPFEKQYKDCDDMAPCLYCGDVVAFYKKGITSKIQYSLDHGRVQWMGTSGRMFFEIQVDSTGHSCVRSVKDETHMTDIKDNLRRCLNNLYDWVPAKKEGRSINSTMILEVYFVGDAANVRMVKSEEIK